MKSADLIEAVLRAWNRREGSVTTRSGKWHPIGSRRQKASTRRRRRLEPLLIPMVAPLWERRPTGGLWWYGGKP